MFLDPRTKLLILAITSVSVFLNESTLIEGAFTFIPFLLLLQAKHIRLAFKSGADAASAAPPGNGRRHSLYVCRIHTQTHSVFYARQSSHPDNQGKYFLGGNQPLTPAERFYHCIVDHAALFSDNDGRMGFYQGCDVLAGHIGVSCRIAFSSGTDNGICVCTDACVSVKNIRRDNTGCYYSGNRSS